MHHRKTYVRVYLFTPSRVNRSIKRVHTNILAKNRKLHKIATTKCNFEKNRLLQTCISTCLSIFSNIGLVDQSKPCTQIYLRNTESCINLQLAIRISKNHTFRHALAHNRHSNRL